MSKTYYRLLLIFLTVISSCLNMISQNMINRTFTHQKTGDIYTIHLDREDKKSGIIKRVFGSEKAESCIHKKVELTCIKQGMIGMPNIASKNYMGMFELDDERCYVFFSKNNKTTN